MYAYQFHIHVQFMIQNITVPEINGKTFKSEKAFVFLHQKLKDILVQGSKFIEICIHYL